MHILVTGASRGIGRACARRFAREGHRVAAVARTAEQLRDLAAEAPLIEPWVADLRSDTVTGHFDVVVLNAGQYTPGRLIDVASDVFADMWELNVLANHRLARRLLPPMIERKRGHLVVIGSTATDAAMPHMTAYAATKKALRGLWEGWAQDLEGTGVRTTLVAPGATLTDSWKHETPPARILAPEAVADLVYRVIAEGLTGRRVIRAD
ncbi:short-subunit dehydrogenase [Neolewinella xylanilytica]|uniref:Short-subunit dehydrogenase n=1 Tax=Neolewinella xylanilytica TaxID=1514080 RepID=A0A2S6I7R3_9BACT|nr:SDR family oxidoreductase [Neolewinella xylanilytica]PPK87544.1 short-subunit dehydrogenase [Neolewinella xylanilytica]